MVTELVTYRVKRDRTAEFESYSAEALDLMRRARGFITLTLLRNLEDPTEYRAEIRWVDRSYRDRFAEGADGALKTLHGRRDLLLETAPSHSLFEPA